MRNLLIISIDALNSKDLPYIEKLSNFKLLMNKGSYVKKVDPVYPSMTYCCHTSIITGTYPNKHGIFNNQKINPDYLLVQDWFWHKKDIKVPTLFDLATEAGLTSSAILWPVMASAGKSIKYNIPEIWSDRGVSSRNLFIKNGSLKLLPYVLKYNRLLDGKNQPNVDNFSEAVSLDIIKKKKPNLMAIHYTELDATRHYQGLFNNKVSEILQKTNDRLGNLFNALKANGTYDNTNIVVLGDHGGADFEKSIFMNTFLLKEGLISIEDESQIQPGSPNDSDFINIDTINSGIKTVVDWQAFANTCGGSVQIHLDDPSDDTLYNKVRALLEDYTAAPNSPIKALYTSDETRHKYNLSGTFSFMLEAKDGYIFRNHIMDEIIMNREDVPKEYYADHGHLPSHENLKTLFFAMGPDIKEGIVIEQACLVDEGPTLAKMLGLSFSDIDGQILDIFK